MSVLLAFGGFLSFPPLNAASCLSGNMRLVQTAGADKVADGALGLF